MRPGKIAWAYFLKVGFFMSFISIMIAIYNIVAKLIGWVDVAGFTTTVFSIWFVGGLLLFVLGIIGLYIGKIYMEVKERPRYNIEKVLKNE